ncbi:Uncharacterised protein [Mycobacterium tuberculosis]|nr:Uncharacterised protein [Mycobacterium tuberculosis]COW13785.1 Uncharacterised protein [Mycobacterium tuberculosis]COW61029.1 Uncharacterised protein [Mycobacterium tuberculosis]COX00198.1 Uncharacterised protein [Mycobacterium tuberculosis]COZ43834.1 Uncharacterised protein [Mycobacterium tuberculosis]
MSPAPPLPPLPYNKPPGPPFCPGPPSAPLPINGRPSNVWVGALIALSRVCCTLAASALAYEPAPAFRARTNWL